MRLPSLKPRDVVRALKEVGFEEQRQTGSHLIMAHRSKRRIIPVPIHAREMKRGLLTSIIKQAGLTQKEFIDLL
ncbi:MAG TPA: type II toxin-antitoxin system HicA family toxin [Candidatus Andersenbacteria bacterium]|nr:type II toxin-antitoxin system HicA family toxin [Candidatus Andersenbacteria bacterium]